MIRKYRKRLLRRQELSGFTIVELLIVIVVIGILAALVLNSFSGAQQRAANAKRDSDLQLLRKAIVAARASNGQTTVAITGTGMTSYNCERSVGNPGLIEPRLLDKTHACWVDWRRSLDRLGAAAGVNLSELYNGDTRGNPYFLNENEGEDNGGSLCVDDYLGYFTGNGVSTVVPIRIPAQSVC